MKSLLLLATCCAVFPLRPVAAEEQVHCNVSLVVLGIAQDAGRPQLGHPEDPAWSDPSLASLAASIAVIDNRTKPIKRFLFEATPDIRKQVQLLDVLFPTGEYVGLNGIFLTHAHMGHYTGLVHIGFEAARTDGVPVFAMPEMKTFLETNGPWDQLVNYKNIVISELHDRRSVSIASDIEVTPFLVPHRREYSETVGFIIDGPARSAVFLPDINGWEEFDATGTSIESLIERVDYAYLDATFYGDELPNISSFPHPKILDSMDRFDALADAEKSKVRFIHLNHSNPALLPESLERQAIREHGYRVADEGDMHCL